ncbi:MAG: thioredoxin family protein [Bacteroidia bacterium]
MPVINSSNDDLRKFVYDKQYVIVKFHTEEDCPVCVQMMPVFERLSNEYQNITFVRMNADDNPIAKKLINKEKTPFIGIYKEGLLVECGLVSTENALVTMLNRLPNINFDL